jgi:2-oxoglutarate ferredoxin oxidoreductase subunit gamma
MSGNAKVKSGETQVRFCGFGGQGVILAAMILGKAATLFEERNAVMTQSYGPEARGGSCCADVVLSDAPIHYPRVRVPEVLAIMAEDASVTYGPNTSEGAVVLVNEGLVKTLPSKPGLRIYSIPATKIAEGLGKSFVANIVMLGFFTATAGIIGYETMKKAVLASIPAGTEELNMAAFNAGYEHGEKLIRQESR